MANLIPYQLDDDSHIDVVFQDETIWMSQATIASLFDIDESGVSIHLKNIFDTGELDKNQTHAKIAGVQKEGKKEVERLIDHYNLDSIISVGYRANSQKATRFRVWANSILKQYIADGYVINEVALRDDPKKLNKLAAKLRELRASEQNIFASVREVFKIAATDYEPNSQKIRSFYALLQDKFHHAVTNMTASKLIMDRANHSVENMGLATKAGITPTKREALIGKNYLREDEMYRLHLLSEQFLLYAETTALRGQQKTMDQLHEKLDELLALNEYPLLPDYQDYLKDRVKEHVEKEYQQYIEIKKLEHLGVDVDLEAFYEGEYNNYKHETSKIRIQDINKAIKTKAIESSKNDSNIEKLNKALITAINHNPKD